MQSENVWDVRWWSLVEPPSKTRSTMIRLRFYDHLHRTDSNPDDKQRQMPDNIIDDEDVRLLR